MTNSDYLIKATIKKLTEKLNKTFSDKIGEASTVAQEVPDLFKKEFEILKDEIINEAIKLEKQAKKEAKPENEDPNLHPEVLEAQKEIENIQTRIQIINNNLDK